MGEGHAHEIDFDGRIQGEEHRIDRKIIGHSHGKEHGGGEGQVAPRLGDNADKGDDQEDLARGVDHLEQRVEVFDGGGGEAGVDDVREDRAQDDEGKADAADHPFA